MKKKNKSSSTIINKLFRATIEIIRSIIFWVSFVFRYIGFILIYWFMFVFYSLFFGFLGFGIFVLPLDFAIEYLTNYDFSIMDYAFSTQGMKIFTLIGIGAPFAWIIFPTETLQKIKDEAMGLVGLK